MEVWYQRFNNTMKHDITYVKWDGVYKTRCKDIKGLNY
jgi:hypothetical protein